jgi:hypothetical protein
MFKPGKQYQYGLHLLGENAALLAALQEDLDAAGAPPWPGGTDVKKALQEWVGEGVDRGPEGRWWSILEEHALNAIADDPGLGFGLGSVDDLASLPVVRCGAAKDLYGDRQTLADILAGKSLDIFHAGDRSAAPARRDPIAEVMVAAKAAIGQFGGALRRLVYSARELRPDDVQQAQCLTEQVTQAALSVKAGKPPLRYADFERQLRRLLRREEPERKELDALLAEIGKKVEPVWEHLCGLMPREAPAWLGWLRKPHELEQLVKAAGEVRLPLNDLRLRCWLEEEG